MINTKITNKDKQLKEINNLIKDESFLYPFKDTIKRFFSDRRLKTHKKGWHSRFPGEPYESTKILKSEYCLIVTYNIVDKKVNVYYDCYPSEAIRKSKFFDTILIGILTFEDFVTKFNKDEELIYFNPKYNRGGPREEYFCVDIDKVISKVYQKISKDYKKNLKILLVDKPSVLKYSKKFDSADVFPFQYLGDLDDQIENFERNSYILVDQDGNLREQAKHLEFIYKKYKERGLTEMLNGSSSFQDLYRYCARLSLDLNSKVEIYSNSILEKDIENFENGKAKFNSARLFNTVSSAFRYTSVPSDDDTALKMLINKSFEYIKKCQTEKTDIDLIGEKDFDICNHFRRNKISTTLAENIIDDFCLNVSLFEAGYRNLDKNSVYEYLDDSIGVLLDSGAKIKIRLLTQKSVSYGSEFMSLVSTTEQSEYIFEWLNKLSDTKKQLIFFHEKEVEALEVLLNNGLLDTNITDVVKFLKSFN